MKREHVRTGRPGLLLATLAFLLAMTSVSAQIWGQNEVSPVSAQHLQIINDAFARNGIATGRVESDAYGRVILKGEYADEREVDRAFSLAQVVVGVRWVSPVTPESIRVKEWERKLGSIFARSSVLQPTSRSDAPPGPIRNRYAVLVGANAFRYGIAPLEFAARDAMNFYQFLTDPARGQFPASNIILLTDVNATRANVGAALDRVRQVAQEDDLVVFYVSSHGSPPDKRGAVHIATYDTETNPRERVWHTSVNEEMLRQFVEGVRAKRLVVILDTCFSNGAYRAVPGFLPPGGKSLGARDDEGYGISPEYGRRLLGAKDMFVESQVSPSGARKQASSTVVEPWGRVLIGASSSEQQSYESPRLRSSVFTYYLLDGLNRNGGSLQQAFDYARPRVSDQVRREQGARVDQTPQAMATVADWNLPLGRVAQR